MNRATSPKTQAPGSAPAQNEGTLADSGDRFGQLARGVSQAAGKPVTFLLAVGVVVAWAVCGPLFGYSDTWQLVINTGTTIVTFLMVFLIQNTQNRDQLATQIKLAELIVAMRGAKNKMALAEEMSDQELEHLHDEYRMRCGQALQSLQERQEGGAAKRPASVPAE
jgi:low affinity Fe/Cu permease